MLVAGIVLGVRAILGIRAFAFEGAESDEAAEIAAAAIFAAKLPENAITFFLAPHQVTFDITAGFAGDDQIGVFNVLHRLPRLRDVLG